jgi:hypothetical protein
MVGNTMVMLIKGMKYCNDGNQWWGTSIDYALEQALVKQITL